MKKPITVGEMLYTEFMAEQGIDATKLSNDLKIDRHTIVNIIQGNSAILTDEMADAFASYFGTTNEFWLGIRNRHMSFLNK